MIPSSLLIDTYFWSYDLKNIKHLIIFNVFLQLQLQIYQIENYCILRYENLQLFGGFYAIKLYLACIFISLWVFKFVLPVEYDQLI